MILDLFKKKKTPIGYWCAIRWSDEAVETGLGYSFLKKIVHLMDTQVMGIEQYSDAKVKELQRKNIVVVDLAKTTGIVPKETAFVPKTERVLGLIALEENV